MPKGTPFFTAETAPNRLAWDGSLYLKSAGGSLNLLEKYLQKEFKNHVKVPFDVVIVPRDYFVWLNRRAMFWSQDGMHELIMAA